MTFSIIILFYLLVKFELKCNGEEILCSKLCVCAEENLYDQNIFNYYHYSSITINENSTDSQQNYPKEKEMDTNFLLNAAYCMPVSLGAAEIFHELPKNIQAINMLPTPYLENSTISKINLTAFKELIVLDIKSYQLETKTGMKQLSLENDAFTPLTNLRYLNLENVWINSQGEYEPENEIVSKGIIINNRTKSIPISTPKEEKISIFKFLTNLIFLRIYRCKLNSISPNTFEKLNNLRFLSLEGNELTSIPIFTFDNLKPLTTLILRNNNLQTLNKNIFSKLESLEYLDIAQNNITTLEEGIFSNLFQLRRLNIQCNPLRHVASNIFQNNEIYNLYVGCQNYVSDNYSYWYLQDDLLNDLEELKMLVYFGANLTEINNPILQGSWNIEHIQFQGFVPFIPFNTFSYLRKLKVVILKNCSINSLSMDAFHGLSSLSYLDLSTNYIDSLPSGIFDHLNSLQQLILSSNKLSSLPLELFMKLPVIKMIWLQDNPWHCTCELRGVPLFAVKNALHKRVKWEQYNSDKEENKVIIKYQNERQPGDEIPKCKSPPKYKGQYMLQIIFSKLNCD